MSALELKSGNKKRLFIIWLLLMLVWLFFISIPSLFKHATGTLIFDPNEYASYYDRGGWIYSSNTPISEYPQIPTYLFGVNRLAADAFSPEIRFGVFYALFSLEMLIVLFFLFKILEELLPQKNKIFALLMFLPPVLYFVVNRFDILPAYICLYAFQKVQKRQWIFASLLLAIGAFTKWYPVLLFPGFFVYAGFSERKPQWKMVFAFLLTSMVILLPTFIQGGTASVLAPYQFHFARGMEYVALPVLACNLLANGAAAAQFISLGFMCLQFSSPMLGVFFKVNSLDDVVEYSVMSIALFILFSRINSPQWFLWLMPFLILAIREKKDVFLILLYNIITYLFFPVVFNSIGNSNILLKSLAVISYLILAYLSIKAIRIIGFNKFPFFMNLKEETKFD